MPLDVLSYSSNFSIFIINMSSGTYDKDGTRESDLDILQAEYEGAKERLSQQQDTFKEFSREGLQMFRLLLLFVAAPTALFGALDPQALVQVNSIITSNDCAISGLGGCMMSMKVISALTSIFFIVSAGMNLFAAGYEARGVHNASNPEDLHRIISNDDFEENYWRNRLKTYRDRIDHNDRIIWMKESLLALGKVTLLISIFGISSVIVVIMIDSPLKIHQWLTVLLVFLFPMLYSFRNAPKVYLDADAFRRYIPLYEVNYKSRSADNEKQGDDYEEKNSEERAEEDEAEVETDV
ncbi:hypothetical protein HTG_07445 [Natrinema mahii]|nr:hypothetical protein HTG_07445 [Natrinema mahii]